MRFYDKITVMWNILSTHVYPSLGAVLAPGLVTKKKKRRRKKE
jgi:hypothetical protein